MKTPAAFLAIILLIFGAAAHAALTASLSSSVQNSAGGQTLVFCGTLVNTSTSAELFLNNIQFTLNGNAANSIVSGSNAFYENVPGILLPGANYTGEVFSVALNTSAPPADYTGSITLQGGANIFSACNLATQAFTLLSPSVTLVATSATASEVGPAPGAFTITRTGGTEIALPVAFSIGGTAANGSDYQAIATTATIAAGSSSATVTITPIPNDIARPNPTVTLALASSTLYDSGAPASGTVTIQIKPADAWRYATFGALANTPQAADMSDWSGAGVVNLIAFALAIDPLNPNLSQSPSASTLTGNLTLTYVPNPAATDVNYSVEASTDLIHWSAANVLPAANPPSAPPGSVTYRYLYGTGAAPSLFMRLSVARTDD